MDRGKQGRKRSTVVDGHGIPLGTVIAPAARKDSPLLEPTLDTLAQFAPFTSLPPSIWTVDTTSPARWVIERPHAWLNAYRKLVWCTERRAAVIIIVSRLVSEGWTRYQWTRPPHMPRGVPYWRRLYFTFRARTASALPFPPV